MAIAPWSVKGIDSETREAAKTAARRAGVTLGTWLNQAIQDAASEAPRPGPDVLDGSTPHVEPPDGSAATRAMFETIQKMSARLEELERRLLQAPPTLSERLDRLTAEMAVTKAGLSTANEPTERAIARLSERVQRLEIGGVTHAEPPAKKRFGLGRNR